MSHITHEYPRADDAASRVDPFILASALDHIAKTAARSRTSTRRLRWIELRALGALRGEDYRDIDVDLPYSPGSATQFKLSLRLKDHATALRRLVDVCERMQRDDPAKRPSPEEIQEALAGARALIGGEAGKTAQ